MVGHSWKDERFWGSYYKKMSNPELIKNVKDHNADKSRYRGTVLVKVANKELARRKASGQMRKIAGKPRQSNGFQLLSLSGRRI